MALESPKNALLHATRAQKELDRVADSPTSITYFPESGNFRQKISKALKLINAKKKLRGESRIRAVNYFSDTWWTAQAQKLHTAQCCGERERLVVEWHSRNFTDPLTRRVSET